MKIDNNIQETLSIIVNTAGLPTIICDDPFGNSSGFRFETKEQVSMLIRALVPYSDS